MRPEKGRARLCRARPFLSFGGFFGQIEDQLAAGKTDGRGIVDVPAEEIGHAELIVL